MRDWSSDVCSSDLLYGLRLTSFFFPERHFSAAQIAAAFAPGPGVDMQLAGDHVAISSSTEDPYLVVQGHHLIKRVIGVAGDHIVADGRGFSPSTGSP